MLTSAELAAIVDPCFAELFGGGSVPGFTFGVIKDGELLHTGGLGALRLGAGAGESTAPGPDTVFRIASMTKSFTAATVLSLRDEGRLGLDQPAVDYVPELNRGHHYNQLITLRHLLTMRPGFATDDPWGDRQQALAPKQFADMLGRSLRPMWRPGERFEYSNLGYAILGRVIESSTGLRYREVVHERILEPLSLTSTGFDAGSIPMAQLATGYVRRGTDWVEQPIAGYGAFAPMGGLLSNVRDLAKWVSVFLAAERFDDDADPLNAGSLREMQQGQAFVDARSHPLFKGAQEPPTVRHYGMGLFEELLPEGRTVGHSGGYPGFGSHMRWHPRTGLGIVALGNRTYAPMAKAASQALTAAVLASSDHAGPVLPAHPRLAPARYAVKQLINDWDDDLIAAWFTENVHDDEPWESRRARAEVVRARHGRLTTDPDRPATSDGPAHTRWWLVGEAGGWVKAELLLSPHADPLIQWVQWTSVPDPSPALATQALTALRALDPTAVLEHVTGGDGTRTVTYSATSSHGPTEVDIPSTGPPRVRRTPRSVDAQ